MGAESFKNTGTGRTAEEAFNVLVKKAKYDYGHRGYTGTIAEKDSFVMVSVPADKDVGQYVEECFDSEDHFCLEKWGPAACILVGPSPKDPELNVYVFFGVASS